MRKILSNVVDAAMVLLVITTLNACKKYTDVQPVSEYSVEQTFSSVTNAFTALMGAYGELQGDNGYGSRISMYWQNDTDESVVTGNIDNNQRGIGRYQMLTSNPQITNPFNQLYEGIEKANMCIDQIPNMDLYNNGSADEKTQLRRMHGEALTLRAQYYHELIRNFGDVPATFTPAYKLKDLLLKKFIDLQIFPQDVTFGINRSIHNLSASTCSDPQLFKILYRYDEKNGKHLVEQLSIGDTFKTEKGDFFVLKQKRRTRFACENIHTKKIYLFPGIYEVFKE